MIGSSSITYDGCDILPNMNPKAMEAELIQKATQTAIVAARSILMSGGTEESALKTAKAAAESVLNPAATETDSVSGRSTLGNAFGGKRRKAKRQAEVVASMALLSATSLQPTGNNIMGDCDSLNKMYGRNIITVRQDEPSVLSGSTRPPKPPTPGSTASVSRFSFKGRSQKHEVREPVEPTTKPVRTPLPPTSPSSMLSSTYTNLISGKDEETEVSSHQFGVKTLSQSCFMDSEQESSVDSSLLGRSGSEDESDEETAAFFFEKRKPKVETKSKSKKSSSCSFSEALMGPLAATLNIIHCGGGTISFDAPRLEHREKNRKRSGKSSGRSRARESSIVDSRDDIFDEDTTFSYGGTDKKGTYRDPDFPNSYSYTSSHSNMTDFSEQEINVRSSIRETMENLVHKSKLTYRKSKPSERKKFSRGKSKQSEEQEWKSYESSRNKKPIVATAVSTPKQSLKSKQASTPTCRSPSKRGRPKTSRGRSFFKRK